MIPENLWHREPLPKRVMGQLLVRLAMKETVYVVVSDACPSCAIGGRMQYVDGWITLHEQPAPSTQISKNAWSAEPVHFEAPSEEIKAGQRHCFMCHSVTPDPEWIQLVTPSRHVCSPRCHENYRNGADLT